MNMPPTGPTGLPRLARLAPGVADELHALSRDVDRLQRRIEALLGGQEEVILDTEVVRELLRWYEQLESCRTDDLPAAPFEARSTSART